MEQRAQVPVECPQCHWKHFVEMEIDQRMIRSPLYAKIQKELEEWIRSRCPDHLGVIAGFSKN
ncbi:MAG: hypothetical protein ACLQOO_27465 [Terriglobia bacterium]